jgi:uncharacterized protein YijF (DUF1287 family)
MRANRKKKSVWIIVAAIALLGAIAFLFFMMNGTSTVRRPDRYNGSVAVYKSNIDKDSDGIDDQTDILQSAIRYIETRPKYKSKYYDGGYPDDGYGVCTDLVAAALKGAGYDLRELVDQDIHKHPENYDVVTPDSNIDYRRVKNLRVWFKGNAISCSMDLKDIDEWQGGDIVIFENHIGIVSDRRNERGVPYVIHHSGPSQLYYEEDILEQRNDLVGHYRMS